MKISPILAILLVPVSLSLPACAEHNDEHVEDHHKIVLTSPVEKDVVVTQQYVCLIHSQRHIKVCALANGFLEEIPIKEGQAVKQGEVLFQILPTLYKARADAETAKLQLVEIKLLNTKKLASGPNPVVSQQDVAMHEAEVAEARANLAKAKAELGFTSVTAPFDGIVDRLFAQQGSKIKEEDILTTLSDNSMMWVYFNVPEVRYLEFKALQGKVHNNSRLELVDSRIELVLADGSTFDQTAGNTVTVEGKFNNETGNIAFRADFPNPDRLLRHGQTGNVMIRHKVHNAIVIPQRATFEILDKQYVYVVDKDNVVQQRLITVQHEMDDVFVIKSGIGVNDRIVIEGVRQVHEGEKLKECEFLKPEEALANQKHPAE